jgi:hypothetical protein
MEISKDKDLRQYSSYVRLGRRNKILFADAEAVYRPIWYLTTRSRKEK